MSDSALVAFLFLQLACVLVACQLVGVVARAIGQPQVVAEMVTGFLLGPSVFGWLAPDLHAALFPRDTLRPLYVLSHIGLALYMFTIGLEFRGDLLTRHARRAAAVSIVGIVAPFALGGAGARHD